MRVWSVLDTSAGPNSVQRSDLPINDVSITSGLKLTISDANGRPLNITWNFVLYVHFWEYVLKCHFYVCELLVTSYVLFGDFFDRFLKIINPRQHLVELYDVTQVSILRLISNHDADSVPIPKLLQSLPYDGNISQKDQVSKLIIF